MVVEALINDCKMNSTDRAYWNTIFTLNLHKSRTQYNESSHGSPKSEEMSFQKTVLMHVEDKFEPLKEQGHIFLADSHLPILLLRRRRHHPMESREECEPGSKRFGNVPEALLFPQKGSRIERRRSRPRMAGGERMKRRGRRRSEQESVRSRVWRYWTGYIYIKTKN